MRARFGAKAFMDAAVSRLCSWLLSHRILVALVLAGVVPNVCASAHAAGVVSIASVDSRTDVAPLDLAHLPGPPDVRARRYGVISVPGGAVRSTMVTGYSLGVLFGYAGIDPSSFTVAEVFAPNVHPVVLSNAQATRESAFPDGPPVAWQDSEGAHFLRPSASATDVNESDVFLALDSRVTVYLHSGALLSVKASAQLRTTSVGKRVRFTSSASAAQPGESLTYQWTFDDGRGASQESATHSFTTVGTYNVYVRVVGSHGAIGVSAVVPIKVGAAPNGPKRAGGGTSAQADAPTHGAGAKPATGGGHSTGAATGGPSKAGGRSTTRRPPTTRRARPQSVRKHSRQPPGPLLSGIAVTGPRDTPPRSTPPAGARRAARTGHVERTSGWITESILIVAGAITALVAGALLQAFGRPRIRHTRRAVLRLR